MSVQKILGIMTHRLNKPEAFLPYYEVAKAEGFDNLVVFTPADVDEKNKHIRGYVCTDGTWVKKKMPFPDVAYDVGSYKEAKTIRQASRIKQNTQFRFIGYSLGNRWEIHQHLQRYPDLQPHLIPTIRLDDGPSLRKLADQYGNVIIKPVNGKEGKGIIRLRRSDEAYFWEESDKPKISYGKNDVNKLANVLLEQRDYLVQKWIDSRNRDGNVYDIRSFMQKDGKGKWQIRGMAAREGKPGGLTSNASEGGTPFPANDYLKKQFGRRMSKKLNRKLEELSYRICHCIEESYQKPQAELSLDFVLEREGNIWLTEVNTRPGKPPLRTAFSLKTVQDAIRLPIQYAHYLARTEKKESE
jgi:glutathione synthase/RimK-type ligase-like ATP-grasp enzyme